MNIAETRLLNARTSRPVPLTRLGFGGAPLGNLYRVIPEPDAHAALMSAYAVGMRYFDTAPQYGLGISEARFGRAVAEFGRDSIVLSTKVGRLLVDCAPHEVTPDAFVGVPQKRIVFDYSYDGVMRSHADSKARLGVERIDMLLVHDIGAETHGTIEASEVHVRALFDGGGHRALTELRDGGEILAFGAGVNEWEVCERLLHLGDFDCFMLAGRYTLLEQQALDSFLPLCERRDVGIIIGSPFNSGILATGAIAGATYNYAPAPAPVLERVRRIEAVCAAHEVPLVAASLQFVLGHPVVRNVVAGAVSEPELRSNAAQLAFPIPASFWSDLRSEGLIRADAPTP
ncbi:MAG: aldo/keto reductase [Alphaproteobacteria bacterium]|nr:aldo/keto reductase [Alphaproteobacteria bacterium]